MCAQQVLAEVYPREVCGLVKTCHVSDGQGRISVGMPAKSKLPFSSHAGADQLHVCFIDCELKRVGHSSSSSQCP